MTANNRTYERTAEVIEALCEYRESEKRTFVYTDLLTDYLIEYFQRLDNGQERKWPDVYDVGPYRGTLLLRAIVLLEESDEEWVKGYRNQYEEFWKRGRMRSGVYAERSGTEGALLRHEFVRIMEDAMPERYADYSVLDGVWSAIDIYFNRFIDKIYIGQGMHDAIMGAKLKGVGGVFGQTKLLTWDCAGRLMFTFSRGDESISFIKGSDDKLALSAGVQSCYTDLITVLTMIEDVIANYKPEDFKEDKDIGIF